MRRTLRNHTALSALPLLLAGCASATPATPTVPAATPTAPTATPTAEAAQRADDARTEEEPAVDSLMAEYDRDDSPGAVIGVIEDGEVVFVKGYGMANLTHGVPITPETRFNVGSVAKQFTAFAIALLESRGKVSIDEPARAFLPELPEFDEVVTLRHLLTHTSGYRETYGMGALAGYGPDDAILRRDDAVRVVQRQPELEFAPGSKYQYNSSAYVILALVVERVTGEPFPQWMKENVFEPLGMEHTVIEDEIEQVIPGAADSYTDAENVGYRTAISNRAYHGAADVYTTVGDFARWLDNFDTGALGGQRVQERMRERFVLTSGDTLDYALGINVDEHRGLRRIQHGGSHAGYRASLTYFPELDAGVVVMSNYDEIGGGVAARVLEIFFGEHMASEEQDVAPAGRVEVAEAREMEHVVSPALLDRYAGQFQMEGGPVITFARNGTAFTGRLADQSPFPLLPVSDTVFLIGDPNVEGRIIFHADPDGSVGRATAYADGQQLALRRLDWQPDAEQLSEFAGLYFSEEAQTFYTLEVRDGALAATHRWNPDLVLRPVEQDRFTGIEAPMRLDFERDDSGAITGYRASLYRTTGVWFEKQDRSGDRSQR